MLGRASGAALAVALHRRKVDVLAVLHDDPREGERLGHSTLASLSPGASIADGGEAELDYARLIR